MRIYHVVCNTLTTFKADQMMVIPYSTAGTCNFWKLDSYVPTRAYRIVDHQAAIDADTDIK